MKVTAKPKLPIKRSGVYSGIDINIYHSDQCTPEPSVSSSNLRTAWAKSMAHMFSEWAHNPNREPRTETEWMRFGRAAHHLFLSEDNFSTLYVKRPDTYRDKVTAEEKKWNANEKSCKKWLEDQRKAGRTILTSNDLSKIAPMVANLRLEPLVQSGALNGLVEHSLIVKDKETGLWLKARPDNIPNDGDYVDLKLTGDVTDLGLIRSIGSFGYHMQGGMLWEVCEQLGLPFTSFTLLCIESERPFCVRPTPLTDEDLARGRQQCRLMIRRVAQCIDAGHWPGPGEGDLRPLPISAREREAIDYRLSNEGAQNAST